LRHGDGAGGLRPRRCRAQLPEAGLRTASHGHGRGNDPEFHFVISVWRVCRLRCRSTAGRPPVAVLPIFDRPLLSAGPQ
jgi:hypothetical protein